MTSKSRASASSAGASPAVPFRNPVRHAGTAAARLVRRAARAACSRGCRNRCLAPQSSLARACNLRCMKPRPIIVRFLSFSGVVNDGRGRHGAGWISKPPGSRVTTKRSTTNGAKPPAGSKYDHLRLEETVGFLLSDSTRTMTRAFSARIAVHGVGMGIFQFLRILWEEDGLTQVELADRARMRGPSAARRAARAGAARLRAPDRRPARPPQGTRAADRRGPQALRSGDARHRDHQRDHARGLQRRRAEDAEADAASHAPQSCSGQAGAGEGAQGLPRPSAFSLQRFVRIARQTPLHLSP